MTKYINMCRVESARTALILAGESGYSWNPISFPKPLYSPCC